MPPLLQWGSRGKDVSILQAAMNLWPYSLFEDLVEDGIFGGNTHRKVIEYQTKAGIVPDGKVGPISWGKMAPLVDAVLGLIEVPANEKMAADRIVQHAEASLAAFGWPNGVVTPTPGSPRIAAAVRADPNQDPSLRQGGHSLEHIFMIGGGKPGYTQRCRTISKKTEGKWQAADQDYLNGNDIGAWCGVFAYYVYRCAGIPIKGGFQSINPSFLRKHFHAEVNPKRVRRGSIGVLNGGKWHHHHVIVTENNTSGRYLKTIDGNCKAPFNSSQSGTFSVIARRKYTYEAIPRNNFTYFVFPKLS